MAAVIQQATAKQRATLAFTGFLQVIFVAMNTVYIMRTAWILLVATSFCISFLWSGNVKRVAFGDMLDRIVYALGAAAGCGAGVMIAQAVTA